MKLSSIWKTVKPALRSIRSLFLAHRASIGFGSAVALALFMTSIAFSWLITVFPEPVLKRLQSHCITPNSGRARRPASVE